MNWLYCLKRTDWRNYFRKNGLGEIPREMSRGWLEQPDGLISTYVVHGKIRGGPRGEGYYTAYVVDDTGDLKTREMLVNQSVEYFRSFALPDCRCRIGFHWKCGIHKTWRG
jgi:hypothetical protein